MAKFEISLTCEQWTDKSSQPDEEALKTLLSKTPVTEVTVDMDEVDWTIIEAKWEINLYGEYECADGEEMEIGRQAEDALWKAGLRSITWDVEEEDYPMPTHEIIETFRDTILPTLPKDDRIAKWEAFNNYTDSLCKRGLITQWQFENIDNPWSKS